MRHLMVKIFVMCLASLSSTMIFAQEVLHVDDGKDFSAFKVNGLEIGDYTGAWYPTYYQLGVNWASSSYDPSADYGWATPEYKNTGYAELLDIYMTGLYYTLVTKDEVDAANGVVGPRTEAGMDNSLTYCYSVEGGAELVRSLTCGAAPVIGSLYVEQYKEDWTGFSRAIRQVLEDTDGLMIFDIVHIINHGLWDRVSLNNNDI